MSDMIKIKLFVGTGFPPAEHEDIWEVGREWWESLSVDQQDKELDNMATERVQNSTFEYSFVAEQEWEGCVTWIDDKHFYAHLLDLTNEGTEEEAVFDIGEISSIHQDLLKEGALFRWSIGYLRQKGGTRSRLSSLVFRRLPAWSARDLERSKIEAGDLLANIHVGLY